MKLTKWYRFLGKEIGIEYKACLYFFAILFYVGCYRFLCGEYSVSLLHLAEVIMTTYIMGYLYVYVLDCMDEAPAYTPKIIMEMVVCSIAYAVLSYVFSWMDHSVTANVLFAFYMMLGHVCMLLVNRIKRDVDTMELNDMLKEFQNNEKCD